MSDSMQALVNHFQTEFVEGNEDAHADFLADVESWARVHGLVMGNGQVRSRKSTWKLLPLVRHLPLFILRSNAPFAAFFPVSLSFTSTVPYIPCANDPITCVGNSVAMHFVSFPLFSLRVQPTPVTLVGHPIRKDVFEQAIASAPLFARLVHAVSLDVKSLNDGLESVSDPFTRRLLSILNTVSEEGVRQPLAMGLHRSDYMIHQGTKLQQVEINTISSAFGALSHRMPGMHSHLIQNWANYKNGKYQPYADPTLLQKASEVSNPSLDQIVDLFRGAMDAYCTQRGYSTSSSHSHSQSSATSGIGKSADHVAILMIVQPGERNSVDQRWLQYRMEQKHGLHVLRHCLGYVNKNAQLDPSSGALSLDGYEIAVAYYRAGYAPTDYPTDAEWEARLKVERSLAIKCPNIAYHLVGTKKMQQILAQPGQLEKYLKKEEEVEAVRACFTGLFSLSETDSQDVSKIISLAISHPHRYVMKPQREGGGNLLANGEMVQALKTMSPEERADYILMERIEPEAHNTVLLRDSHFITTPCIAELGVFCTILANDKQEELINSNGGWLLRSKPENVEDGGVAAGRAYLDCPFLI